MAQPRRHNRRRRNRGRFRALYQLLAVLVVVAAIAAGCVVFFRVRTVTVEGNSRYTADEIVSASGFQTGDYLALLDKGGAARQIRSLLPYVESVGIRRSLPDSVLITVSESSAAAAVEADGSWWLVNSSGKLLESLSDPAGYPTLTGLTPSTPLPGTQAVLPEEDAVRWTYALNFLSALEEKNMLSGLLVLDCSTAGTFTAGYEGEFTLLFPSTGNFAEYLTLFHRAVSEELAPGETGVFDFTHYESTGYVYFRQEK